MVVEIAATMRAQKQSSRETAAMIAEYASKIADKNGCIDTLVSDASAKEQDRQRLDGANECFRSEKRGLNSKHKCLIGELEVARRRVTTCEAQVKQAESDVREAASLCEQAEADNSTSLAELRRLQPRPNEAKDMLDVTKLSSQTCEAMVAAKTIRDD